MSDLVEIEYLNSVHMRIVTDASIKQEMSDHFSFRPSGYQFNPKFKMRVWDGYIRLFSPFKPILYVGLLPHVVQFCKDRDYQVIVPDGMQDEKIDDNYAYELAKEVGCKFTPRDYQNEYVVTALRKKRSLSLSPTSSGKSLIIYLIQQHYFQAFGHRTLIIVPTIGLVYQMAGDFKDYGCNPDDIYTIKGGVDKNTSAPVVISTWQSLVKQPKAWFDQFRCVLGDEAHNFQAKSLTTIMEKLVDCDYRHGFTGTLKSDESKTHQLVLEGCFGQVNRFVGTKDLIDAGTIADFEVKAIVLSHKPDARKSFRDALNKLQSGTQKYPAERQYLTNHERRNLFIRNLVWSLEGQNNLILFDLVEKHGRILEPLLRKEGRELHFIYGGVKGSDREDIRNLVENDAEKRHDILASYGVFSTGVNLKKLDNVIFASGSKSEVKVLQSIGRTLRKGNDADKATLYDIADDLSIGSFENYTLRHFKKRIEIYSDQSFPFKIFNIEI